MSNSFSETGHSSYDVAESKIKSCLIDSSSVIKVGYLLFEEPADDTFRYANQQE